MLGTADQQIVQVFVAVSVPTRTEIDDAAGVVRIVAQGSIQAGPPLRTDLTPQGHADLLVASRPKLQ